MSTYRSIFSCLLLLALTACGDSHSPPAPQSEDSGGRPETANIRNTEVIGVEGEAISRKVDAALDASDARKDQLDKAIDAQ